jgi:hypothetical protein
MICGHILSGAAAPGLDLEITHGPPAAKFAAHLTRIRRENPAFNYGFFRPNPLYAPRDQPMKAESWANCAE